MNIILFTAFASAFTGFVLGMAAGREAAKRNAARDSDGGGRRPGDPPPREK